MAKWNRRQFLSGLMAAVGVQTTTAVAGTIGAVGPLAARPAAAPRLPTPPSPAARPAAAEIPPMPPRQQRFASEGARHGLADALPPGTRFGRWRVVAVHSVKLGAIPVVLETLAGERFQVDVLQRDRHVLAKRGIAETKHFALYLANVGRGNTPTPEEHGLGLMWLAALMRRREDQVTRPTLLTLRDRLGHFPRGEFNSVDGRILSPTVSIASQTAGQA